MSNKNIELTILSWNVRGSLNDRLKREIILEMINETKAEVILIQEPGSLDFLALQ